MLFLLSILALGSLSLSSATSCVDLTLSSSCLTGYCGNGGHKYGWSIPILPAKPKVASADYEGLVRWDSQNVAAVYTKSEPAECCAECQKRSRCKYWQFVRNHPTNGDKDICFLYPKNPPVCDGTAPKSNAGGQCQDGCPDLTLNSTCTKCKEGGSNFGWSIPTFTRQNPSPPADYELVVRWEGQNVRGIFKVPNAKKCCAVCKKRSICKYWQYVADHPNGEKHICFLYPSTPPSCVFGQRTSAGPKCPGFGGDPHFIGAQGTNFDFSGMPGESFCLLTDKSIHINMKMTGYLDERTESATVFKNGKAVRSWIREMGFIWMYGELKHTLKLVARATGQVERGSGYLESAEFDGKKLPSLAVGESITNEAGLTLKLQEIEKDGSNDVDYYTLKIDGLVEMDIHVRVAHPLLRRTEDAEAHFDIGVNKIIATPIIHGVLGQTYREGRAERAQVYRETSASVVADAESGRGFLDGETSDYISTSILSTDCRYTGFNGHVMPTSVTSE